MPDAGQQTIRKAFLYYFKDIIRIDHVNPSSRGWKNGPSALFLCDKADRVFRRFVQNLSCVKGAAMKAGAVTTGLAGFDEVIDGLRTGDNVVWQVDNMDDYRFFAGFFARSALSHAKKVVYMRFAAHGPLLKEDERTKTYELDARSGFETFSTQVHQIITREGEDVHYVFDSLSDLLSAWATDLMIGNFFLITCPYLFQLNTVAYFGLIRNNHSFKTVARIRETTQVLLDVYHTGGDLYVHPLKVRGRHSPTMFLPHKKESERFIPLTSSVDATRLLTHISGKGIEHAARNLDYWDRLFLNVEELLRNGRDQEKQLPMLEHLCHIMIGITALTRIPFFAYSKAADFVSPITPYFDAV
jgi:hypothetical protein